MTFKNQMLIDGQSVTGAGESFPVINPATEEAICQCNMASIGQLDKAVTAARKAVPATRLFQSPPV
ncbi:aldehyde dehydrogenase family protein [Marinobacter sp. LV10MA510-1]|jgi:acyl-CoA reductase-like NAD-dependent aldehyde dehydrogenase|uniref:aldehyde dehydrogenase family protein n=1 Tax=Marinobacter sp. LV10MA510-1 TaxID=1415567 RepID=UPI0015CEF84B